MIPRTEVLALSLLMERELRANEKRFGGDSWKSARVETLLSQRAIAAARDLDRAVASLITGPQGRFRADNVALVAKRAADVANLAMMVADVCGALVMGPERPGGDA